MTDPRVQDPETLRLLQRSQSLVSQVQALAVMIEDTVSDLYEYGEGLPDDHEETTDGH